MQTKTFDTTDARGTNLQLTFAWLTDRQGNINGFVATAEHHSLSGNVIFDNIFAESAEDFVAKYPTLEHVLTGFRSNPAWYSETRASSLYISTIDNHCDLYAFPEKAPSISYGDGKPSLEVPANENIPLKIKGLSEGENKELFHCYDSRKICNNYDDITGLSVNILRFASRDGTPQGLWIMSEVDSNEILTDMLYFKSEEEFLKQFPKPKDLVKELSECPLWMDLEANEDDEQIFYIEFLGFNEGMYKLTKVSPSTL